MIRFSVLRAVWLKNLSLLMRQRCSLLFTCTLSALLLISAAVMRGLLTTDLEVPAPDQTGHMSLEPSLPYGGGPSFDRLSSYLIDTDSAARFGITGFANGTALNGTISYYLTNSYDTARLCDNVVNLPCFADPATEKERLAAINRLAPVLGFATKLHSVTPLTFVSPADINSTWQDINVVTQACAICGCSDCIASRLPNMQVSLPPTQGDEPQKFVIHYARDIVNDESYYSDCGFDVARQFEIVRIQAALAAFKSGGAINASLVAPSCARIGSTFTFFPILEAMFAVLGLSVLVPLFSSRVSHDRVSGVFDQLQISGGISAFEYIAANSLTDMMIYWVVAATWIAVGAIVKMYIVTVLNGPAILMIFFLNGIYMILLANLIAFATTSRATAITSSYLAGLIAPMCGILLVTFVYPISSPPGLNLIPPYAFSRTLLVFAQSIASPGIRTPAAALAEGYELVGYTIGGIFILSLITMLALFGPITLARRLLVAFRRKSNDDDVQNQALVKSDQPDISLESGNPLIVKDAVLVARNLSKWYGQRQAVANVSLAIGRGEVYALLGVNGAGKTSLVKMLSGEMLPSEGTVTINGENIHSATSLRPRVGVLPQFDTLFEQLTVFEHVLFFSRLKGVPRSAERATVDDLIKRVGLQAQRSLFGSTLSGGQKRRLSLAIALAGDPSIVFCDEPSSSLDVAATRNLWRVLEDVKQTRAILLTTHNMLECDVLCDRVGIVHKGRMIAEARPTELKHRLENFVTVSVQSSPAGVQDAIDYLKSILPPESTVLSSNPVTHTVVFQAPTRGDDGVVLSKLFSKLERGAVAHSIVNWSISEPTLEGAFLRMIGEVDDHDGNE